ncbi:MAG: hypothetical protein II971_00160 [Firmicutes bacterium]|nr:hypothetical protein [Bacillota bacterium]
MADSSGRTEYGRFDSPFFVFLKALLCVLIAAAICLAGIRYIIMNGPSPRYAEEYERAHQPEQTEEEAAS